MYISISNYKIEGEDKWKKRMMKKKKKNSEYNRMNNEKVEKKEPLIVQCSIYEYSLERIPPVATGCTEKLWQISNQRHIANANKKLNYPLNMYCCNTGMDGHAMLQPLALTADTLVETLQIEIAIFKNGIKQYVENSSAQISTTYSYSSMACKHYAMATSSLFTLRLITSRSIETLAAWLPWIKCLPNYHTRRFH